MRLRLPGKDVVDVSEVVNGLHVAFFEILFSISTTHSNSKRSTCLISP